MTDVEPSREGRRFGGKEEDARGATVGAETLEVHVATRERDPALANREKVFEVKDLTVKYDGVPAVRDIGIDVFKKQITALIGPSGCGKSTLIRCFNRMNDLV